MTGYWSTSHELEFIKGIGKHRMSEGGRTREETIEILRGYIEGCKKRVRWEGIDKATCIRAAEDRIVELQSVDV